MRKQTAIVVIAGACLVAGFVLTRHWALSHKSKAIRITRTVLVAADGRRLAGFFEGLPLDPRSHVHSAPANDAPRCASSGLLARLVRHIETTVYGAESPPACPTTACVGTYSGCVNHDCVAPNCTGTWTSCSNNGGPNSWQGYQDNGTHGCEDGTGYQCDVGTNDCDMDQCNNGGACTAGPTGGNCPLGQYCRQPDLTCQTPWCFSGSYCRTPQDCDQSQCSEICNDVGCCDIAP